MKNMRFMALILLLLPAMVFAQTAAEMDGLLAAETVSAARAARFVLGTADLLPAALSGQLAEKAAYDMASANGWIKIAAEENINLRDTAFLIMKAFDLKGGVMYSLLKSPRYAYRELVYSGIIRGRSEQATIVTGAGLLQMLDRTLRFAGKEEGQ